MYDAMLAQENKMRKDIQMFFRNKLGIHKDADIGGKLFIDKESDFVDTLNELSGSLSGDAKNFHEEIKDAFERFKSMKKNAALEIWIRLDPQTDSNQTYDMMFHTSLAGVSTAAMPISDLVKMAQAMCGLRTETKLEDFI